MNNSNKWLGSAYFRDKYALTPKELMFARSNGLPYRQDGRNYLYREKDIHDYYAGYIGNDIEQAEGIHREFNCRGTVETSGNLTARELERNSRKTTTEARANRERTESEQRENTQKEQKVRARHNA